MSESVNEALDVLTDFEVFVLDEWGQIETVNESLGLVNSVRGKIRGVGAPPASEESEAPQSQSESQRRAHGRGALPKSLRRQRMVYDFGEDKRQCPECQEKLKRMGEEVSERLEYVSASLVVIEEACQKYACPKGCTVVTAEKPMAPIKKGLPGPALLAHVAVSK